MKDVGMRTLKITQEVAISTHNMVAFISNEFPIYSELSNMEEETYKDLIIQLAQCRFALDLITDALVKIEVEG
jgi:hypothetical protein